MPVGMHDRRERGPAARERADAAEQAVAEAHLDDRRRAGTAATESRPWLTIWNVAPVAPMSLKTKIPSAIRLICAIDE